MVRLSGETFTSYASVLVSESSGVLSVPLTRVDDDVGKYEW